MYKTTHRGKRDFRGFQDFVKLGLQGPRLITLLNRAAKEHHFVETMFAERIQQGHCGSYVTFPYMSLPRPQYFERNFFSILFLSVFLSLEIPLFRRLRYGIILHSLRTIVTNADNLLDREQKGAVRFQCDQANPVLSSFLLTLMAQRILSGALREITDGGQEAGRIEVRLLDSLYSVAAGESITSMQDKDEIPKPDMLIRTVHEKIGGELLRLSLVAPMENETALSEPLQLAEKGILAIGVALQMLDDVMDVEEDLSANKTNLLASWIVHESGGSDLNWQQLRSLQSEGRFKLESFTTERMDVVNAAIQKALDGFKSLSHAGYPVKRNQAISILKIMFGLRGLQAEWNKSRYQSI